VVDVVDKRTRSRMMSGIRGKNTKPELTVRKHLHAAGLRFRLSRRDLPGSPDIVLAKHGVVIFVHGCFWHRHLGCHFAATPASNAAFWHAKFDANVTRDSQVQQQLVANDWRVFLVWECEVSQQNLDRLVSRVVGGDKGDVSPPKTRNN